MANERCDKTIMYGCIFKRWLDLIFSFIAIVILSPVFLVVATLVGIKLGSPVIFKQERPGRNEEVFTIYKFRTMKNTRDKNGMLLPDSERLTKFGQTLRSTSLDEIPELFNVLKGDMSLVGPRPLAVKYLPYYNKIQSKRHSVLPGITGLAQVNGRNAIGWEARFAYDVEYVENISFIMDLRILMLTITKVLKRSDIGTRKEQETDTGIEDFDLYCIRHQLVDISECSPMVQLPQMSDSYLVNQAEESCSLV